MLRRRLPCPAILRHSSSPCTADCPLRTPSRTTGLLFPAKKTWSAPLPLSSSLCYPVHPVYPCLAFREETPMQSPVERVEVLRQEAVAFKERIAALSPEDWDLPSACDGWSVADVVAHLSGQAFVLNVGRGLQGDYSPPPGAAPVTEHNEDEFAQNIFQRAFNTRAEAGDQLQQILFQRSGRSRWPVRHRRRRAMGQLVLLAAGPRARSHHAGHAHQRTDHARLGRLLSL